MGALRPLAVARDYAEMHAAFRAYVEEVNVSREAIDDIAGLPDGFAGKALAPVPAKTLGRANLGDFLQSMGLALIVCQDVEAFNRIRHRLPERQANQARPGADGRARSRGERISTRSKACPSQ